MGAYSDTFIPWWEKRLHADFVPIPGLALRKARLMNACLLSHVSFDRWALFVAMAMIETTHMTPEQRDKAKDGAADGSANRTMFNINEDMLGRLGAKPDPDRTYRSFDNDRRLGEAVSLMQKGLIMWGCKKFLFFVRAGGDGFDKLENTKYEWEIYFSGLGSALDMLDHEASLMKDGRRIQMDIPNINGDYPQGRHAAVWKPV